MRNIKPIVFSSMAVAATLFLSACNTTGQTDMTADWSNVTGKNWQLTMLTNGDKTLTPTAPIQPSALFAADGKVSGSSGCNNYFGTYTQTADQLTFSPLGATRKMCINGAMEIETAFNAATGRVASWTLSDGNLVLLDGSGKAVMTFAPTAP